MKVKLFALQPHIGPNTGISASRISTYFLLTLVCVRYMISVDWIYLAHDMEEW